MKLPATPLLWKAGAALALAAALVGAGAAYRQHVYQLGYDTAVGERAARDGVAILHRTAENVVVAASQASINTIITKVKNEELAHVRERIVTQRVYVGTGICPAAGSPDPEGTGGGNGSDSPGRLVRPDIERDIRALKVVVEEDLATARACQGFVRQNGMEP